MNKYYKIKVGIEEFAVDETDIPRIVEAMKNNDMVRLSSGLFRGQAILAICRDSEREDKELQLTASQKTNEAIEAESRQEILKKQKAECNICNHTGWEVYNIGAERRVKPCECRVIKKEVVMVDYIK